MNRINYTQTLRGSAFTAVIIATFTLGACASAPTSPQGSAEVRSKLTALQNDPELAPRARVQIREAEAAVREAEEPISRKVAKKDEGLGEHRVFMADRRVEIARAVAVRQLAEDQRKRLGEERDQARLQARTIEADRARSDAERARAETGRAQSEAEAARLARAESSAESQRMATQASEEAARHAAELQGQIDALQAEATDRGLVVTLGDVLFATGSSELQPGPNSNLNKLVSFLKKYPDQRVLIEGHTDSVGSADFNMALSQRRAEAVRNYLTREGVASQRLTTSGMGMDHPVASNATATGRLQNRRVEIVIERPQLKSPQATTGFRQ